MPQRHPWTGFRSAPPPKTPVPLRPRPDRFIEIGKVFGRLTCVSETDEAEFWLFRCTCGKRVKTTARHLRDGKRSCGCLRRELSAARLPPPKIVDMTGQTWYDLTVIDRAGSDDLGAAQWRCRCVCGFVGVYRGAALRTGETKSCGCRRTTRHGTLIGRTFENWTVTREAPRVGKDRRWICQCTCGATYVGRAAEIKIKRACSHKERDHAQDR